MSSFPPLIPAPEDERSRDAWRRELTAYRRDARERLRYTGEAYAQPAFAWARSNFACCMAMLFDTTLYDAGAGRWRVHEFLRDGVERLGGYDSVVLWHA